MINNIGGEAQITVMWNEEEETVNEDGMEGDPRRVITHYDADNWVVENRALGIKFGRVLKIIPYENINCIIISPPKALED